MFRISNNLVGILNLVTFFLSIPILVAGIWLSRQSTTECSRFLSLPIIVIGAFLMAVSLAGFIGACCRVSLLLWIYLAVMFLLIVLLACFTVFAFVVTNKGAGEALSGRGYKEYRLGDYSNWLQKRVGSEKRWNKIRSCLEDSKICESLTNSTTPVEQFFQQHLNPLQSGCCKPSNDCSFDYTSPTVWNAGANSSFANPDCRAWSNDQSVLCFNCQSCKAGLLDNIKSDWKKVSIINIVFLIILIVVYSVGCCAFRNNREHNSWK